MPGDRKIHDLSSLHLRPARPDDGPELNRVCFPTYSAGEMQRSLTASLKQAKANLGLRLIAELDQQIVGSGQLLSWCRGVEIADLVVAQPYRNRGIGRTLINRLLKEADLLGYPAVEIGVDATNQIALTLYRKIGFVEQRTINVTWQGQESVYIYMERVTAHPTPRKG